MKRTAQEIADFADMVLAALPRKAKDAIGIVELSERVGIVLAGQPMTRTQRRQVHDALASLRASERVVQLGLSRATRYHRRK